MYMLSVVYFWTISFFHYFLKKNIPFTIKLFWQGRQKFDKHKKSNNNEQKLGPKIQF